LFFIWQNNAQIDKYTYEDFTKAHYKITQTKISNDGNWISYSMSFDHGEDTLVLQEVFGNKIMKFDSGKNHGFSPDSNFFSYVKNGGLELIDLGNFQNEHFSNVTDYHFSKNAEYIIMQKAPKGKLSTYELVIKDLKREKKSIISGVSSYLFNPKRSILAYIAAEGGKVGIIKLDRQLDQIPVFENFNQIFSRLIWSREDSLAFFGRDSDKMVDKIYFFKGGKSKGKLYYFNYENVKSPAPENRIWDHPLNKFFISEDEKQIFFEIESVKDQENEEDSAKNSVQIWRTADKDLFSQTNKSIDVRKSPKLAVWWPETGSFAQIGSNLQPQTVVVPNSNYALTYNPFDYRPNFKHKGDFMDINLTNFETGESKVLKKKQIYNWNVTLVSPGGKYISYFKDNDWWVYNIEKKIIINVTSDIDLPFFKFHFDRPGIVPPYGNPGWTINDEEIIIYDEYDIWLIDPEKNKKKRITNGREKGIQFRIYDKAYPDKWNQNFFGFENRAYDLNKILIIKAYEENTKKSGFYTYGKLNGLEEVVFEDANITKFSGAKEARVFYYFKERFNLPPQLVAGKDGKFNLIHQTNSDYIKLNWEEPKLLSYKGIMDKELQGALFYPSNFDKNKKYPLLVNVYELKSQDLHKYVKPDNDNAGFNPMHYTNDGYFVLSPDIAYEIGNPGLSATEAAISAVKAALETESIDESKLGLLGHSFGGYETSFILTQTNMFAAAMAGSAFTDLFSWYLSLDEMSGNTSQYYRFEWHQQRFNGSPFEYKKEYLSNSVIHNAESIRTPLLLWTGKKDITVDWRQSLELHLALRRLGRDNIFVLYPEEGHLLFDHNNIEDITNRIKSWFNYYLKNEEKPEWIN